MSDLSNPLTRIESYLAGIAGVLEAVPDPPLTRIEEYLSAIYNGGGGGGGGGGGSDWEVVPAEYIDFDTVVTDNTIRIEINPTLKELRIFGFMVVSLESQVLSTDPLFTITAPELAAMPTGSVNANVIYYLTTVGYRTKTTSDKISLQGSIQSGNVGFQVKLTAEGGALTVTPSATLTASSGSYEQYFINETIQYGPFEEVENETE